MSVAEIIGRNTQKNQNVSIYETQQFVYNIRLFIYGMRGYIYQTQGFLFSWWHGIRWELGSWRLVI